jgi:hypothetical protein
VNSVVRGQRFPGYLHLRVRLRVAVSEHRRLAFLLSWAGVVPGFVGSFGGTGTDYNEESVAAGVQPFLHLGGCKKAFLDSLPEYPDA